MLFGHLFLFFGKMSIQVFWVFDWIVCFFLIELYINPLSVASFANIFFHIVGGLFISLVVSFAVQKLLSLIQFSSVQSLSRVRLFASP